MEETRKQRTKRKKKMSRRQRIWLRILCGLLLIAILLFGIGYWIGQTTYRYARVVEKYERTGKDQGNYIQYMDGVLKYSRDGIVMLSKEGEEIWNQPCQMGHPTALVNEDTAVVADKGGTSICVFEKKGLKGEIQTTRPIEKVAVSTQGIVAAVLQDEETPLLMCYDAKGNVLVEQQTSLKNTGYPLDLALSKDGEVLAVSYLCTNGSGISTKVYYYHFGEEGNSVKDHIVSYKEYSDAIAPTVAFQDKENSFVVMDSALVFYKGLKNPEEKARVKLNKEIHSVAYDEKYVALVLKDKGKSESELRLYQSNGKLVVAISFAGEYTNVKVIEDQILLYDGTKCMIYNNAGVCKFKGNLEVSIADMYPTTGFNKYMVISADGFREIQLAR